MGNEELNSKELKEDNKFSTELKKLKKIFKNIPKDKNGSNQWGTKVSTEASVYNTMIKNYTSIIKQLCELLPDGLPSTKEGNALMNFVTKPKGK